MITLLLLIGVNLFTAARQTDPSIYNSINIVVGEQADDVEQKVAQLLRDRINEKSTIRISVGKVLAKEGLNILMGRPDHHERLENLFEQHRIPMLTDLAPGPEGFLLKKLDAKTLLAAGIDDRGCLYAVGELLRQIVYDED